MPVTVHKYNWSSKNTCTILRGRFKGAGSSLYFKDSRLCSIGHRKLNKAVCTPNQICVLMECEVGGMYSTSFRGLQEIHSRLTNFPTGHETRLLPFRFCVRTTGSRDVSFLTSLQSLYKCQYGTEHRRLFEDVELRGI